MVDNDIQFEKNGIVFNYRISIIIRKENKILVQKDTRVTHLALPGGRCELGESSSETAIREFLEETGIKATFVKELGLVENFFHSSFNGKNYHEILIVNELKLDDKSNYDKEVINNIEEKKKDFLSFTWESIEDLKKKDFRPKEVLDIIDSNEFSHLILKDEKLKKLIN